MPLSTRSLIVEFGRQVSAQVLIARIALIPLGARMALIPLMALIALIPRIRRAPRIMPRMRGYRVHKMSG